MERVLVLKGTHFGPSRDACEVHFLGCQVVWREIDRRIVLRREIPLGGWSANDAMLLRDRRCVTGGILTRDSVTGENEDRYHFE